MTFSESVEVTRAKAGPSRGELLDSVANAMANMSEVSRIVIVLRANGLANAEIAQYLGIEFAAVLNHFDDASAALAAHIDMDATKREFEIRRDVLLVAEMLAECR